MAITTDWDAGFQLAPGATALDVVPPGGEYVVECTPPRDVLLEDVTVRDFQLDRLYVGTVYVQFVADESPVATGHIDDRRYHLDPPVAVAKTLDIRAVLKNTSDVAQKPKVAVLLHGGQEIPGSALKDWRVVGVRAGSAARPLSPSCPTCDSPDRDTRRQTGEDAASSSLCGDTWHDTATKPAKASIVHAPKIARTLHDGPGNATLVQGCSCGAEVATARAFADHVGVSERAFAGMLNLVGVIYDLCDYPTAVTREEAAQRVARCLEFTR